MDRRCTNAGVAGRKQGWGGARRTAMMSVRPVKELSMNDFDRPGAALDEPATRRSAGSRLADLGDRLSKTFGSVDRVKPEVPSWETDGDLEYSVDDRTVANGDYRA